MPPRRRLPRAVEIAQRRMPTYGDPTLAPVELATAYAELVAVAVARSKFYGELLAAHWDDSGEDAFIGGKYAAVADRDGGVQTVLTAEEVTVIAQLEAQERDRAERLIREAVKLGMEARQADVLRRYSEWIATAMQNLAGELGVDWQNEATRRAAQRAVLSTRQALGVSSVPAAAAGPRPSAAELESARVPLDGDSG